MKNKINMQLTGIAILAILSTVIGITFIYYSLFQKQVHNDLMISAKLLKDTHYFESVQTDTEKIDLSTDITELRVTWIDSDGTVLYDNDTTPDALGNHLDRPEIQSAFATGTGEAIRKSDTMNKNTYYYAILLDNQTVLRVATQTESLWAVFCSTAPTVLLIIAVIIGICIGFSRLLTKQLIRPIEVMAENIGDADVNVPYKELEPFARTIRKQHTDILSAAKARQDFTANVSHELKTPLTAISGYAQLLDGGMVEEENKKHFYQEIQKNADRLLALINDIIKLSELDRKEPALEFTEIDLCEIAKECTANLELSAAQADVSIAFEGEPCIIHGNRQMIEELAENLIQNAIRYNNPGGRVWVSVMKKEHPVLLVKDNGIGIPANDQEHVFERFYRVDKSRSKKSGGTGLGLAIVKHIVEIHNASILLDSALNVGTTIEILF